MKKLVLLTAGILIAAACTAEQAYPNRAVRLVVGWGAGGAVDALARLIGQHLSKASGQAVIVDNKPGAGSAIANTFVAKAAPDGYTLLVADTSFSMLPAVRKSMPYDSIKDFVAVAEVASMPMVVLVPPSSGVKTLAELVTLSKAQRITYASGGIGSVFHLVTELLRAGTGLQAEHVPYKGGSEALTGLIGGQVQFALASVATSLPYVKSGKLVPLAVMTTGQRLAALPNVPTMTELGQPGLAMSQWYGIFAPAGTPPDIVMRIQAEAHKALESAEVRAPLLANGFSFPTAPAGDLAKLVASDLNRWKAAAKVANVNPE